MRGSGFGVPTAIIRILDMSFGSEVYLNSKYGKQVVTWRTNMVSIGSILRILEAKGIHEGAEVFLSISDDRAFDVIIPPQREEDILDVPHIEALRLAGHPSPSEEKQPELYLSRALNSDEELSYGELQRRFSDRGDKQIAFMIGLISQ